MTCVAYPEMTMFEECILAVDDQPEVLTLIARMLSGLGYRVITAASCAEAIQAVESEQVALVLADVTMPGGCSGLDLITAVQVLRPSLPVVLVTGSGTCANLTTALERGAAGIVGKPFTVQQLREGVQKALGRSLLAEVELRERALTPAVAAALAGAMEARQNSMAGHTKRLVALSREIGRAKALAASEFFELELGSILHDVGKIGIPDEILLKPGLLTPGERLVIETHVVIGDKMLRPLEQFSAVRLVVRHHHERWDGTGYPDRLAGEDIPLLARIVAVADAVEAMCGERSYRPPLGREDVLRELAAGRGTQWDPELTDIVLDLVHRRRLRFGAAGVWLDPKVGDVRDRGEPATMRAAGRRGELRRGTPSR